MIFPQPTSDDISGQESLYQDEHVHVARHFDMSVPLIYAPCTRRSMREFSCKHVLVAVPTFDQLAASTWRHVKENLVLSYHRHQIGMSAVSVMWLSRTQHLRDSYAAQ